ncbi:alpha/beta hydrolase [Lactococcus lactis]|uniref:alpha/beta hydrolase n=1 Tax=Lactococcus lactis TaxID=1358 RepID=UPI00050D718B|nr:alpha/beta hydrolase [Lactococcus lactis]AIS04119.1 Alpha/beta hydrolase [Lactococcus lactis]
MKKRKKMIAWILVVLSVVLVGGYFAIGNYFYDLAVNAHTNKSFLTAGSKQKPLSKKEEVRKKENKAFLADVKSDAWYVTSSDKLKLKLYAADYNQLTKTNKWAIVVHGYGGQSTDMASWTRHFYNKGYNVVTPDLRGHGKSQGDYIGMGWDDRKDMLLWIAKIIQKDPQAEIVLLGVSMGGATVTNTSGEKLPSNVKAIVEDCGFTSTGDVFAYQLKQLYGLPKFPVLYAANTVVKMRAGYDIFKSSAIKQVAKSKTPILFIHGDKDTFVPFKMLNPLYDAAKVEKEKLIVHGAGHGESEKVNPDLYWSHVWNFVGKYMS